VKEKHFERIAAGAGPLLESGEQVKAAVQGLTGSLWLVGLFGAITILLNSRIVVVTDRNIYVTRGRGKPTKVESKYALGSVGVEAGTKTKLNWLPLSVGEETIWVARNGRDDAREIAKLAASPPAGSSAA
jgi:hypothetical protein